MHFKQSLEKENKDMAAQVVNNLHFTVCRITFLLFVQGHLSDLTF